MKSKLCGGRLAYKGNKDESVRSKVLSVDDNKLVERKVMKHSAPDR